MEGLEVQGLFSQFFRQKIAVFGQEHLRRRKLPIGKGEMIEKKVRLAGLSINIFTVLRHLNVMQVYLKPTDDLIIRYTTLLLTQNYFKWYEKQLYLVSIYVENKLLS